MTRDLARTRATILDAAEQAFADAGYDGASMQGIADAAGVSRGMPGYAFGSKARLYEAVLDRAFAVPRELVARSESVGTAEGREQALRVGIEAYLDFLAAHPTYVRLLCRAALDGGRRLAEGAVHGEALAAALSGFATVLTGSGPATDADRHGLVSVLALCFFPFAHRHTLLAPLGLDLDDPTFLAARKAHVVEWVLRGWGASPREEG